MFARDVLKTLYSPIKAFEEIVKKPDIKGPLLILVLILVLTTGSQYASASKILNEVPMTNRDDWTESIAWISRWTSNGEEMRRDVDKVVGNYSVASSVTNNTYVWMKLADVEPFNCSGNAGYERLSFSIKWINLNGMFQSPNATLKLFSDNGSDCFKLDFGDKLSNSSDEWRNVQLDVGPESEILAGWDRVGSPNWNNVTGVKFALVWSVPANLTMKIDDLYFAKFVPLSRDFFSVWLGSLNISAISFFIHWGLYGVILLLVIKLFGEKVGPLKTLFLVVGYLFSVRIVNLLVTVALIPSLPETRWENLAQVWFLSLPYQTIVYFGLVTDVWMAALCTIATRFLYTLTWRKAIGIAVSASLINFILRPLVAI